MASTAEAKFPTFECIISNTQEDYDSEVENFFLQKNYLVAQLAKLRRSDPEWAGKYEAMIKYLGDLSDALVEFSEPPSHQFLIELSLGEELEDDRTERLLRAPNDVSGELEMAALKAREIMYWYVRNAKDSKYSRSFTPERFQGLPFLRLALTYRSVNRSRA